MVVTKSSLLRPTILARVKGWGQRLEMIRRSLFVGSGITVVKHPVTLVFISNRQYSALFMGLKNQYLNGHLLL